MESVAFNEVVLEDSDIIHDSTKEAYRTPLGAVPVGTEVTLSLFTNNPGVTSATLCVLKDGIVDRIAMRDDCSPFVCMSPSVLWYWFEIGLSNGSVCYYGAELPYASGLGRIYRNPPPAFQITIFEAGFSTPDWVKEAIIYQIFPDRFCMGDAEGVRAGIGAHLDMGRKEFELHEDWHDLPVFEAKDGRSFYIPSDIFGGDLEGIRTKLPYLKELGVTLLYLNPIFEAASNHRYNTGDYLRIDPILGDAAAFRKLAEESLGMGIRLVLDGVFSHTGDDSLYFNKYGRYDGPGAYQSKDSPYYCWYDFQEHPDKYASWWGFETLPEVKESDPGWQEFMIAKEDSVVKHWLREGASGYRLDVADELPDEIIEMIRTAVKDTDPEAFLLGEVWEDATTKLSYGAQRTYALGLGLDSVMNYPFLNRTIEFLLNKIDARMYTRFLSHQRHTYPAPMYYTLMNLISSHDVSRIRTMLSCDIKPGRMSREEQARYELTDEEYALGGMRQRLAAAIQFSLPGVPAVYYGDETGMTGLLDPFNRRAFAVEDESIIKWYRALASIRQKHPVMSTGKARFFSTDGSALGILRHASDGKDFFGKEIPAEAVLTVINPMREPRRIVIELDEICSDAYSSVSLLYGREVPVKKGLAEIDIPPLNADIFLILS